MIKYKLTEQAKQLLEKGIDCRPHKGTPLSAGMDLKVCSEEEILIHPYETVKVMTGLHIWLGSYPKPEWYNPEDTILTPKIEMVGFYLPRSSNKGLQLENTVGVLDCDYQGESFLKLYNKTDTLIKLQPGERIAQLVIIPVIMDSWHEVDSFDELTTRGEGGDGSTGKH